MPCTTILVGKAASYDGSTIVARNEDSGDSFSPKKFIVINPEDQPTQYRSVLSHIEIDLSGKKPMRYTAVPEADPSPDGIWAEAGVNSANVAMSATETITSNERVLGADPLVPLIKAEDSPTGEEIPGGIGEEDLVTLTLPYIHSAREGVELLGALHEKYGTYEMNAIAFSDVDEIWWFESVGGHHWIARRVPDDSYVTMPNQLGIDEFDLTDALGDQEDYMCSVDLREFIEDNHLSLSVDGDDTKFNPRDAFGSHSDHDHIYNTPRAWYMQRFFNPYDEDWDSSEALHNPESDDIPWARQPERKITIDDVKYILSSHYQGTPYDPYGKKGDEHTRGLYRTIGINRTSQLAVLQIRDYVPAPLRALQWMSFSSNVFNTLMPFYVNIDATPEYLANTKSDTVTTDSFYWTNRIIAALADAHFRDNFSRIADYAQDTTAFGYQVVKRTDAAVADEFDLVVDDDELEQGDAAELRKALEAANQEVSDYLKKKTDELLAKVLHTTSLKMKSAFAMTD
jgi:dipeptidase